MGWWSSIKKTMKNKYNTTKLRFNNGKKLNLEGRNLTRKNLNRVNLTEANLYQADLRGASLKYATLNEADLSEAKLTPCKKWRTDLTGAKLIKTDLGRAKLNNVILTGADLSGADLTYSHLNNADLSGANFTRADLTGADLTGVILNQTKFYDTDLSGATISESFNSNAVSNNGTKFDLLKHTISLMEAFNNLNKMAQKAETPVFYVRDNQENSVYNMNFQENSVYAYTDFAEYKNIENGFMAPRYSVFKLAGIFLKLQNNQAFFQYEYGEQNVITISNNDPYFFVKIGFIKDNKFKHSEIDYLVNADEVEYAPKVEYTMLDNEQIKLLPQDETILVPHVELPEYLPPPPIYAGSRKRKYKSRKNIRHTHVKGKNQKNFLQKGQIAKGNPAGKFS